MSSGANRDFDEPFGGPPDADLIAAQHQHYMDSMVLTTLIILGILLICLGFLAYYLGRKRGLQKLKAARITSAEAIYNSVRYSLDKAMRSSGGLILERGREVADILEARLGYVMALNAKPGKLVQGVEKAIKGEKPAPAPDPAIAKIKVPLSTEAHHLEVWRALQGLSKFWEDKPRIMAMIEAAQAELALAPPVEPRFRFQMPVKDEPVKLKPVKTGVAPPVHEAVHAPQPEPVTPEPAEPEPVAVEPLPEPPEPPPPPAPHPGKSKKALPAHKRNMLA